MGCPCAGQHHANLLHIVPILSDVYEGTHIIVYSCEIILFHLKFFHNKHIFIWNMLKLVWKYDESSVDLFFNVIIFQELEVFG